MLLKVVRFQSEEEILLKPISLSWSYLHEYIYKKFISNFNDIENNIVQYVELHMYFVFHTSQISTSNNCIKYFYHMFL